jgi:hypothetical protein
LEEGAGGQGPISFSKSGHTRQADHFGQEGVENDAQERERGLLSDLPFAARILYTPQLGCT